VKDRDDGVVAKIFLEHLPKLDIEISVNAGDRLRFEYSLLSAAGLTHEAEVELVKALVGDEFSQAQPSKKSE
jgi:hypothetical protein